MVILLHDAIPVLDDSVVIVLRTIQLVMGEGDVVLCSSNWVRVSLIPKMYVRYVEVIGNQNMIPYVNSFILFTRKQINMHKENDTQSGVIYVKLK